MFKRLGLGGNHLAGVLKNISVEQLEALTESSTSDGYGPDGVHRDPWVNQSSLQAPSHILAGRYQGLAMRLKDEGKMELAQAAKRVSDAYSMLAMSFSREGRQKADNLAEDFERQSHQNQSSLSRVSKFSSELEQNLLKDVGGIGDDAGSGSGLAGEDVMPVQRRGDNMPERSIPGAPMEEGSGFQDIVNAHEAIEDLDRGIDEHFDKPVASDEEVEDIFAALDSAPTAPGAPSGPGFGDFTEMGDDNIPEDKGDELFDAAIDPTTQLGPNSLPDQYAHRASKHELPGHFTKKHRDELVKKIKKEPKHPMHEYHEADASDIQKMPQDGDWTHPEGMGEPSQGVIGGLDDNFVMQDRDAPGQEIEGEFIE